ncbi:hypothetical protein ACFFQW_23010 [Umezawaea endophytica]|uniref:Secreted protein n=1 Tax=Umezawaea endophytica TaxID=1654476 RepID=A0A9X3AJB4_9PSEU|nr:hypothetical protein [Umezawaea endophytica]MCS7481425.1 hypothetical protein [Umezawaea endophytica]
MRNRNALSLLAASAALAASTLAVVTPGTAAAATAPSVADFRLVPSNLAQGLVVNDLDQELPKLGVQNILIQANRDDAPKGEDCTSPALSTNTMPVLRQFCFTKGDVDTTLWVPQGVTTVADAQADQLWGDKRAILVSWYNKETSPAKGVRVSFLDPDTGNYQHVLLAYPYINGSGNPSYEAVTAPQAGNGGSVHAGGIVWYGNYLYLADTNRGVRVFDMRYIFDIKSAANGNVTDTEKVGRQDGTYYSYGYRYVMPQISGWTNPGGLASFPADYKCLASGPQKFSYISLDRSTSPHSITTGEYCADQNNADLNGRVARWPMNQDTGAPLTNAGGHWQASEALRLHTPRVQGAVSTGGLWYLNSTGGGTTGPGHLQSAWKASAGVLEAGSPERDVAIGVEDLSYWPGRGELWTVTEHDKQRILYATPLP